MNLDDRSFNRLALGGMLLSLLLLALAFGSAIYSYSLSRQSTDRVRHTYRVVAEISTLELQLERMEAGRRGFLLAQNPYRLQIFETNAGLAPTTLARLERLSADNPAQREMLKKVKPVFAREIEEAGASVALARAGRLEEARQRFAANSQTTAILELRELTRAMHDIEDRLLLDRAKDETRILNLVNAVLWITGILLFGFALAALWLVRRYTGDLTAARDRLHLLNTDLEGQVDARTADLTRANAEIQRFAYIVSHDLRSPLVNVMGFTSELETATDTVSKLVDRAEEEAPQLVTPDVRDAREDLPEAIGFIRSSTQKMDRLINAILKLSRQGQRNLVAEKLPMPDLLGELARSLEHRLTEADASLTVDPSTPDIVSDRLAIEQIFSNLMENAVKYLQPGRKGNINVTGRNEGQRIIYEVIDNGRGIDESDRERVFDLFRRAGRQDQPGEGIGLAHVRALVYRLGGLIEVDSVAGEGSTFRVNLPATLTTSGAAQ